MKRIIIIGVIISMITCTLCGCSNKAKDGSGNENKIENTLSQENANNDHSSISESDQERTSEKTDNENENVEATVSSNITQKKLIYEVVYNRLNEKIAGNIYSYNEFGDLSKMDSFYSDEEGMRQTWCYEYETSYYENNTGKEVISHIWSEVLGDEKPRKNIYDSAGHLIRVEEDNIIVNEFEYDDYGCITKYTEYGTVTEYENVLKDNHVYSYIKSEDANQHLEREYDIIDGKARLRYDKGFCYDEKGNSLGMEGEIKNINIYDDENNLVKTIHDSDGVPEITVYYYVSMEEYMDNPELYYDEAYEAMFSDEINDDLTIENYDGIYVDENDTYICDTSGKTIASVEKGDFSAILSHANGYYLLLKVTSGFDGYAEQVGLMKQDGTWVSDYTDIECSYLETYAEDNVASRICQDASHVPSGYAYGYMGGNMFYYAFGGSLMPTSVHVINAEKEIEFDIDNLSLLHTNQFNRHLFDNQDYAIFIHGDIYNNENISIYSKTGIYDEYIDRNDEWTDTFGGFNKINNGGFVYWLEEENRLSTLSPSKILYYDINNKKSILLYDDQDHINPNRMTELYFKGDKCVLFLIGNDGKEYYSVVDKKGKVIVEPQLEYPEL